MSGKITSVDDAAAQERYAQAVPGPRLRHSGIPWPTPYILVLPDRMAIGDKTVTDVLKGSAVGGRFHILDPYRDLPGVGWGLQDYDIWTGEEVNANWACEGRNPARYEAAVKVVDAILPMVRGVVIGPHTTPGQCLAVGLLARYGVRVYWWEGPATAHITLSIGMLRLGTYCQTLEDLVDQIDNDFPPPRPAA